MQLLLKMNAWFLTILLQQKFALVMSFW